MAVPDAFFDELRREYLTEAPARLTELKKDLAAARAGEPEAAASLKTRFHRLAGSGGSYGFPEISDHSRRAEHLLKAKPIPDEETLDAIEAAIAGIAAAFDQGATALGLPLDPSPRAHFGWRAVVIAPPGGVTEQVERLLQDAQYTVSRLEPAADPTRIPLSERPDVAVIGLVDPGQLALTVERWARPSPGRPSAVLLVARPGEVDPLVVPFAHLDAIFDLDRVDPEVLRFAHSWGRSKTAPRTVLVASAEAATIDLVGGALASAEVSVVICRSEPEIRRAFSSTPPDLVVTAWTLPDTTGGAIVRWTRQLDKHQLTPVIIVSGELSEDERTAAERAGADLILPRSIAPAQLAQTLLARIERSFRARADNHRDLLTGLLSRPTMVEELEHTIPYARRTGESISYLAVDLDHFRRINEARGAATGDRVLVNVARIAGSSVRAGDFVARMGGEEIGVLLRRCSKENAMKVAEKLRANLAAKPTEIDGEPIAVRASVGVASYPEGGPTAQDLLRAAERALAAAKAGGRDRVSGSETGS